VGLRKVREKMRKGEVEQEGELPKFFYGSFDGFQVAQLPYRGRQLGKVVMLPPESSSVSQLESCLHENPRNLGIWLGQLSETPFSRLEIPKHEVRGSYGLVDVLQNLGVKNIFDLDSAELGGYRIRAAIYKCYST